MTKNLTHPKYRPDIDGLRAVAILLVVAFHAFSLKGGFVGVDIFFIISGFLISTIIFSNLESGSFSFWQFYARRIRRIFPSLIIVFAGCVVFGWFVLFSDEYRQLGNHIFRGALFISNFTLLREVGYFDNAAETKPLLHLWSLAVEEQFYIIWPLIVWSCWKKKISIGKTLVICISLSFLFCLFETYQNKSAAFYLPHSRFWEILIGAVLAYLCIFKKNIVKLASDNANLISVLGAIIIVLGVCFISKEKYFPGLLALMPTLGAVLLIAAGQNGLINKVLGTKPLVLIGLISFPLYLWHWPLLSFATVIGGEIPSLMIRVVLVAISFVLALLTYVLMEKPFRFGGNNRIKLSVLILLMFIVALAGYAINKTRGYPKLRSITIKSDAILNDIQVIETAKQNWICSAPELNHLACYSNSNSPEVVVVGDSHAGLLFYGIRPYFEAKGINIAVLGSGGCPPFVDLISRDEIIDTRNCLSNIGKNLEKIIKDPNIKKIILINRGSRYTTKAKAWDLKIDGTEKNGSNLEVFTESLRRTIKKIEISGKKVIYVHNVPDLGFDIKKCLQLRPFTLSNSDSLCGVKKNSHLEFEREHKAAVEDTLSQFPNVKQIDLARPFCDQEFCYGILDNKLLYVDSNHISKYGAELIGKELADDFIK